MLVTPLELYQGRIFDRPSREDGVGFFWFCLTGLSNLASLSVILHLENEFRVILGSFLKVSLFVC